MPEKTKEMFLLQNPFLSLGNKFSSRDLKFADAGYRSRSCVPSFKRTLAKDEGVNV
jgi:hypothetical protein